MEEASELSMPQLHCPKMHKVHLICASIKCKENSLICFNETCESCRVNHEKCLTYNVQSLIKQSIRKRQVLTPQMRLSIGTMEKIYDEAIEKLSIEKELMSAKAQFFGLNDYEITFVRKLQDGLSEEITGSLIHDVIENLKVKKQFKASEQSIKKFWNKKKSDFDGVFSKLKQVVYKKPNFLDSQITDRMDVIAGFFKDTILSADLLYRASDHQFSTEAFHSICAGVTDTLILAKTQYGNIIGAYAPFAWPTNGSYIRDDNKRTFLFSVTNETKYTLASPQYAMYGGSNYGPTFGGGHDFYIASSSNTNRSSYFNVPTSYIYDPSENPLELRDTGSEEQTPRIPLQNPFQEQQSNKKQKKKIDRTFTPNNFVGSPNDYYATIIQWEVFRLEL